MAERGRPKGIPKTGGRQKGTPNKVKRLGGEDFIRKIMETMEDTERMEEELAQVHGKDYFRVYCDLQAFLRPKYSSVEFSGDVKVGNEVADKLKKLMDE